MRPCRKDLRAARFILLGLLSVAGSASALELKPGQSPPKRLYSNGDSIMRAVDAFFPFDNLNLSWVNGYHGFWQRLAHIPNVNAHNQRISEKFGKRSRKNWIAAQNGARMEHFKDQAAEAAGKNVTYATVMLGGNDVCRSNVSDLPDEETVGDKIGFRDDFREGLDELLSHLPKGATVYVAGIPDVPRLYDIGKDKELLGIVNCPFVWDLTKLCGSVLSSRSTGADREFVRERITGMKSNGNSSDFFEGYNRIMEQITMTADALNPEKFLYFTDASFTIDFQLEHISDLDCFHPSWEGQRELSRVTWEDSNGPNFGN
ncbi:MAG: SGNH/GDSL hydrolase family protein [Gammaproteobacteria bacterium]|jgi:lysophospholipase L1-like esterase|nr:SGNH/GDSL hydrolase family protein [Gammaproteobacteria bacterium]